MSVCLETARLILRDYVPEDLDAYFRLKTDEETMYYLQDIRLSYMEEKDTGEQAGSIGYTVREAALSGKLVDAGYFSYRKFWGQGCMTEALRRLLAFAFEEDGVYRFSTGCLTENRGSERVMQKCGLIKEAEKPDWTWHGGKLKTRVEYRLLRKEWTKS